MPTVRLLLTDAADRPLQSQTVKVSLVAPGNPFTGDGDAVIHVATVSTPRSGADVGVMSVDLRPNDEYEQLGTYYRVDARDGLTNDDALFDIVVPDLPGPLELRDLIVDPPAPGEPIPPVPLHTLASHSDVADTPAIDAQVLTSINGIWTPFGNSVLILPDGETPPVSTPAGTLIFHTT